MLPRPLVVGLGEILWDVFPDGPRFGGAPANFVCSAAGLGGDAFDVRMASAVGLDDLGQQALEALAQHQVDTSAVARLPFPTGQVLVSIDEQGHASYEFAAHTAWDHIPWSDTLNDLASHADVVCYGSLGQRSDVSRKTIQRFLKSTGSHCLRLFDINLRPPFWTEDVLLESLQLASALKLNDEELPKIATLLSLHGTDQQQMQQVMDRYDLQFVALTRGAQGAALLHSSGHWSEYPSPPTQVVDTVGAGDAFTAALTLGLMKQLPLDEIHQWAVRVAAFVCAQAGATPTLPMELRWREDGRF